jgi:hypothetical protein
MRIKELPILLHQLALLQAYLYEIFDGEKQRCENNFKHTKWYLKDKHSEKTVEQIIAFFNQEGLCCDCDVIRRLDLRNYSSGTLNFHK